jgi:transposase
MMNGLSQADGVRPALFIGIDWADQEHEACVLDGQGTGTRETIQQSPEAIDAWVAEKLQQSGGRPIAILLEQKRGALIHALMFRENVLLYPINPKQLAHYRRSYSNAACKADVSDARLLARMLRERYTLLKPWLADDEATRSLARLSETRRRLINELTRLRQQLIDQLKAYFPLVLQFGRGGSTTALMLEILRRWPDPRQLRRADRRILHKVLQSHGCRDQEKQKATIEQVRSAPLLSRDRALIESAACIVQLLVKQIPLLQEAIERLEVKIDAEMKTHPDASLFTALPGAGKALAPRLLAAFGSQRDRYASSAEIAILSGIAPVTKQSGKTRLVHRRYACSKFLRQTFHEFADHARRWCPWSKAYYRLQRDKGMKHHAAVRKLASRWIRILYRVWKTRRAYDADAYLTTIKRKNPAIIPFLTQCQTAP